MSIGPLDITNIFGGNEKLPTTPPTDEIGSTNLWSVNVPGWMSYVSDSLEKSPELQWPRSIQTYSDMRHDAQVQGLYLATSVPVRRYHWLIDPNDCDMDQVTNLAKDLSLNIKEHEPLPRQKYQKRFDFGAHLRDALVSILMGHYAFEQVGEIGDDGKWHLTNLAPRPPETITEINIDAKGNLLGFKQLFSPQMIPVNRVTWYPFMMEGANWTGRSLLRACYRNWLRKDRLLRVDAQKQERNGIGIPIAEAPPGMSGGAMLRLDMLMRKMRAGDTSGGAVPNGTKVSLVGTTGTLPDTIASIRLDNEEMARSWLAMFMQLGQTQTGSRALGTEFIDFFSDSLDELANWICQIFTASVIENWWGWNVDEEADATPQLVYSRNPDTAYSGREFAMLLERGAIVMDDELENAIRERYGLPARTPGLPRPYVPQPPGSVAWPPQEGAPTGVTTPSPTVPTLPDGSTPGGSTSPAGQGPMSDVPVHGSHGSSERTVTGKSLSPVTLPNRPLRRELFAHELKAAVDWGSADANWKQQRDLLVSAVRKPQLQQMDELHDQLVEAGNSLTKIGEIQAPPLLEDIIFTHMSTMATLGAHDAQQEASRQHVTLQLPDLNELSEQQRERAKVVDQFLADTLTSSAKSSAFVYAGGSLTGKEIADKVKDDLINLTTGYLTDQLGGALTAAMNDGRKATMAVAEARVNSVKAGKRIEAQSAEPAFTVYSSELLDDNTCDPCASIDGTAYETLDDASVDYPAGGYTDCDGWSRCRGTLVAVYGEVPEAPEVTEPTVPSVPGEEPYAPGPATSWPEQWQAPPPDTERKVRPLPDILPESKITPAVEDISIVGMKEWQEYEPEKADVAIKRIRTTLQRNFSDIDSMIASGLRSVEVEPITDMNALAYYQDSHQTIRILPSQYFNNDMATQSMREDTMNGWWTPDGLSKTGADRTLSHEIGHYLDHSLPAGQHEQLIEMLHSDYGLAIDGDEAVSQYGATNDREMIAELWAEWKTSPSPRDPAKAVGNFIEGWLGAQ